jgi:molybdenum cofactor sulfurtransferase
LLKHGLDAIAKLGGMKKIHEHTQSLIVELVTRLQFLCHPNGQRAVVLYGRWREYNPIKFDANHRLTEMMELPMTECGPTVSFNLLRPDGSFVGYHEIEKLASLSNPAIQLRTGCFCNSGSCQEALGYTDEEMIQLASKKMKICGDNKDLIDGKPTGAVRVSFGPYSTFEDMDAFVTFLGKLYIDTVPSRVADKPLSTLVHTDSCQYQIAELYVFPIKSCAGEHHLVNWSISKYL